MVFKATFSFQSRSFLVNVAVHRDDAGLAWWLDKVEGEAPSEVWTAFLSAAEAALKAGHASTEGCLWLTDGVSMAADREALGNGIAFTRTHLDNREALRLGNWNMPELAKVDPKYRRYIVLAWLFGELDASKVGTTSAMFEKIAKDHPKLVTKTWRGLDVVNEGGYSVAYRKLMATSVFRMKSRNDELENLLLLRDPAEICAAVAKEIEGAKK